MTSLCRLMTTSALFGFVSFILPEGASASFLSSEGDENALPNLSQLFPSLTLRALSQEHFLVPCVLRGKIINKTASRAFCLESSRL